MKVYVELWLYEIVGLCYRLWEWCKLWLNHVRMHVLRLGKCLILNKKQKLFPPLLIELSAKRENN
jgi:hypothetical protein